jgi:hypothetical protein
MNELTKGWRNNDEQIVIDRLNDEIKRLKAAHKEVHETNKKLCASIQELVDALENPGLHPYQKLIQRAREATKLLDRV